MRSPDRFQELRVLPFADPLEQAVDRRDMIVAGRQAADGEAAVGQWIAQASRSATKRPQRSRSVEKITT